MFLLKKIVSPLFLPLSFFLALFLLGLFFLWLTKKQKTGKIILSFCVLFFILLSYGVIANHLLYTLERKYPSILNVDRIKGTRYIVVLGGGASFDEDISASSQLSGESLQRVVEGIRLYNLLPGSQLILSGGTAFGNITDAEAMKQVALELGVQENDILMESDSLDTKDEAKLIKTIVGDKPFVLVTSAYHMKRSIALFKKQGLNPVSAPAVHYIKKRQPLSPGSFFPSYNNIKYADILVREKLGIAWAKLRGQI
jgi:uncharacterized SAM-binding protein YcdF (DUF218 family)